jgi:hypothetical protein
MRFHADLHVHSKYSRATSRDLDLEHLAAWAVRKGLAVVATGDFTHPAWRAELKEKLVPAEPGLFRLRPEIEQAVAEGPLHWGKAEDVAPEELAEERRLFYVGMTRAKDRLVLSRALKRLWRARVHTQAASPFLADIESELVKEQRPDLRRRPEDRQLKLL